jgi:hypothetical protein
MLNHFSILGPREALPAILSLTVDTISDTVFGCLGKKKLPDRIQLCLCFRHRDLFQCHSTLKSEDAHEKSA